MDETTLIIILGGLGFALLAFVLLAPVFLFLKKEERLSREWTDEALAERYQEEMLSADGHPGTREERPEERKEKGD